MIDRRKNGRENCGWRVETFCRLRDGLMPPEMAGGRHASRRTAPATCRELNQSVRQPGVAADGPRCLALDGVACPFAVAKPRYDPARGELSVCGVVVLRFDRLRDRHKVLCAFEDQGWPPRIVDPLGGGWCRTENGYCDIVYRLNRAQVPWLIDFSCDGSGHGIRWKLVGVPPL